jgi:transcriptional regulator with XRE-family HTH domain
MTKEKDKLRISFGSALAEKRKKKGLTQAQLSGLLGISQESLSLMENGEIAPKFSRLQNIADVLSCSVADLFKSTETDTLRRSEQIADMLQDLPNEMQDFVFNLITNAISELRELKSIKK